MDGKPVEEDVEQDETEQTVGESHQPESAARQSNPVDTAPPLPNDQPPLPEEALPEPQNHEQAQEDDGWAPVWEPNAQAYYFYNHLTGATQWTNPRVPEVQEPSSIIPPAPGTESTSKPSSSTLNPPPPTSEALPAGGYNPAIHGDYDPNAWYAQTASAEENRALNNPNPTDPANQYAATAAFNRFTGRFQNSELTPENFNDENKSKRQMNAFFDVDAAANNHEGKSLKAERSGKKLSKTELKNFKEKRKAKKEEKRRAWLKD